MIAFKLSLLIILWIIECEWILFPSNSYLTYNYLYFIALALLTAMGITRQTSSGCIIAIGSRILAIIIYIYLFLRLHTTDTELQVYNFTWIDITATLIYLVCSTILICMLCIFNPKKQPNGKVKTKNKDTEKDNHVTIEIPLTVQGNDYDSLPKPPTEPMPAHQSIIDTDNLYAPWFEHQQIDSKTSQIYYIQMNQYPQPPTECDPTAYSTLYNNIVQQPQTRDV